MLCPLLTIAKTALPLRGEPPAADCIAEQCAWWRDGECVIQDIAYQLVKLIDAVKPE